MTAIWKRAGEPGEYVSACGRYRATRGYHRLYGEGSWHLYGLDKVRVFRTFAALKTGLEKISPQGI